jgi:CRP/FNR family transcriptional regulator, nitrogen oxide reductase regulator
VPLKAILAMNNIPEKPGTYAVIQSCTLLNGLEPEARERLAERSFMAYAEKGEIIWMSGAPSDYSGIVGVGFVKMTKSSPNGQEVAVELLGPGQAFGLLASIEGRAFPLSATAVTNTWYLKLPTREMITIYNTSLAFKDAIIRSLGPRLRRAHEMMSRLSSGKVEERLAAVLFILADSYGREMPRGVEIEVPLTRHDLSEMAGTTTESTIRVLSRWQKEGIIATERHVITILQPEELQALLEG